MAPERERYHPKDAIQAGVNGALILGGAGFFVSAVQNALAKENRGMLGVFTRTGGTVATFTAVGASFEFTKFASANLREKDDSLNAAIGGFLAGGIMGLRGGTAPAVFGMAALVSIGMGTFEYTQGWTGYKKDPELDEFERKQALRANRRRPIEETISEIGEGRGIKAPGYEERRKQRLKEKYNLDVPATS